MARSTYVYVALADGCPDPLAGFTVKHELRSWLERLQAGPSGIIIPGRLDAITVYRLPDGGGEGTVMRTSDILAE